MLAVRTGGEGKAVVDPAAEIPTRGADEALIKILRAGICNTDLEILKGHMGFQGVLGHEFVGVVADVDDSYRVQVGQRVVGEINLACNKCDYCNQGGVPKRNHCKYRKVLGILQKDGTFAQYITLPVENLYVVPDQVSTLQAAFTEPLAAAFRIVEQNVIKPHHKVAVIGDGKLGLLIAEVIAILPRKPGWRLVLLGKHEEKMKLITAQNVEKIVATGAYSGKFESLFDVVIEASGDPSGVTMAGSITKPLGTVILKTTCAAGTEKFNTATFFVKEITILGSRCGNFSMALEAMATGAIKPEKLLTKVYPFKDAEAAIRHAGTKGTLKIQLNMEDNEETKPAT